MRRIAAVFLGSLMLTGIAGTSAHADGDTDFQNFSAQYSNGDTSGGIQYTLDTNGGFDSNDED
ncbi:hypothetical protein OG892_19535 [Streptomyces sp. NBC_00341]|uniref:hypothetical protein n=1 Tax=unclassified Streptomyces TaxID=2593676 RepID=UPI00093DD52A|nr:MULTISPECIES: hypothetical protein [unclassified Streptomyces]OKK24180.1 hypothetical protein AMK09_04765 [Streptomyces sp. CB02488]WRZ12816.1 hypothetical protein OG892_19535 [Streptomyces sp. NBC_00341]